MTGVWFHWRGSSWLERGRFTRHGGITLSIGWLCQIKVEAPDVPGTHLHKATQMLMLNLGRCFHNTVKSMKEEGEVSAQKYALIINICLEPEVTLNYTAWETCSCAFVQ